MDIKELKKLINEELNRKKLQEQPEVKRVIYPEDVILTLLLKTDSLSLPENSAIQSAVSNINMKIDLARNRIATLNKYMPHDAQELTMQQVYSSMKDDPKVMEYILQFLHSMGATETLISNFKNKSLLELEKFKVEQPKTNPGTPSKIQEPPVSPTAKTETPPVSQHPMVKALAKSRGQKTK